MKLNEFSQLLKLILLFIHCCYCLHCVWECVVLGVLSSLAIIMLRERELVALLWLYYGCKCSLPLPRGAVDWSAVSDCGISW